MTAMMAQNGTEEGKRFDRFFLEAVMQREKGNHDAAFDLLRHCVEIDSTKAEAYYFLAQYHAAMNRKDMALADLEKAAGLEPENTVFLETLADAYMSASRFEDAIDVLERVIRLDSDRPDLLDILVQLYQQQGKFDQAISVLGRLEQLDGKSERLSYAKSSLYSQMGDKKKAIGEMKALAEEYPFDLYCKSLYGEALLNNDSLEAGVRVMREILEEEPQNVRALMAMRSYYMMREDTAMVDSLTRQMLFSPQSPSDLRQFLMRQEIRISESEGGDSTRILDYFRELLALPQPDADLATLCATYMELKKVDEDSIVKVLNLVLNLAPDNAGARLKLVSILWDQERLDSVVSVCRQARQYNPDQMGFYYFQGMAHYIRGENEDALETFKTGIDVITEDSNPDIVSKFYEIMGDLLFLKQLKQEAYAAYDSSLQWKHDNIGCLNNYAYYLSVEGENLDKAEQMSLKTVKAEPHNATYLDTYAWILYRQERFEEARIYIDQALQYDSAHSYVITEHAGDIYASCGNMEKAVELWREAVKTAPEDARLLRRKLKKKKLLDK